MSFTSAISIGISIFMLRYFVNTVGHLLKINLLAQTHFSSTVEVQSRIQLRRLRKHLAQSANHRLLGHFNEMSVPWRTAVVASSCLIAFAVVSHTHDILKAHWNERANTIIENGHGIKAYCFTTHMYWGGESTFSQHRLMNKFPIQTKVQFEIVILINLMCVDVSNHSCVSRQFHQTLVAWNQLAFNRLVILEWHQECFSIHRYLQTQL